MFVVCDGKTYTYNYLNKPQQDPYLQAKNKIIHLPGPVEFQEVVHCTFLPAQ
jgi:hypothetical protein